MMIHFLLRISRSNRRVRFFSSFRILYHIQKKNNRTDFTRFSNSLRLSYCTVMKKSSSSSKRKERSRSPPGDSKSKRVKPRSKSKEREKGKGNTKPVPRKTRWQAADKEDATKSSETQKEQQSGPTPRIRDFLHDKEKIVDLLFQTVTGAALQDLIPDYLKNRNTEELKRLCLREIKPMTNETILEIISGKVDSSNKDEDKNVEKEQILKLEQPSPVVKEEKEEDIEKKTKPIEGPSEESQKDMPDSPKTSCTNLEARSEEENVIPLTIKDEIARDLILPERDAELLELEMRARAIRSLLKSKTQSANEEEISED